MSPKSACVYKTCGGQVLSAVHGCCIAFLLNSLYNHEQKEKKALEMNKPKGMMLLVEIHNEAAIHLCESVGFEKADHQNGVTAYLQI